MSGRTMLYRFVVVFLVLTNFQFTIYSQASPHRFPVKRTETPESWRSDGWRAVDIAKKVSTKKRRAKNVILFIGDGMGISTLTAARILEGQLRGESGEENRLSFEEFPFSALSKTYQTNIQTSDSASTMSSIMTGVKTGMSTISLTQNGRLQDFKSVAGNEAKTLIEYAEEAGKSTGVISTARLTHATPAACYAHSPHRDWESDKDIFDKRRDAFDAKFPDLARQLIEFKYGDGLEVALGGGRTNFLPSSFPDPEYPDKLGKRVDARNLTAEWLNKGGSDSAEYVWNKAQFDAVDTRRTKRLLGLFEPSHMNYEADRLKDKAGEPSLAEMTTKALDILANNRRGYFLMVEGGRIDLSHHDGSAYRALVDTIALSDAVRSAIRKINLDETLVIVTADHSHSFVIQGYPARGNNILGLVRETDQDGNFSETPKLASDGKPLTTLGYLNGPGAKNSERPVITHDQATHPDFVQESAIKFASETHGGEDVAVFATGVNAHLIRGSMEQNWLFYVMADALRLAR